MKPYSFEVGVGLSSTRSLIVNKIFNDLNGLNFRKGQTSEEPTHWEVESSASTERKYVFIEGAAPSLRHPADRATIRYIYITLNNCLMTSDKWSGSCTDERYQVIKIMCGWLVSSNQDHVRRTDLKISRSCADGCFQDIRIMYGWLLSRYQDHVRMVAFKISGSCADGWFQDIRIICGWLLSRYQDHVRMIGVKWSGSCADDWFQVIRIMCGWWVSSNQDHVRMIGVKWSGSCADYWFQASWSSVIQITVSVVILNAK